MEYLLVATILYFSIGSHGPSPRTIQQAMVIGGPSSDQYVLDWGKTKIVESGCLSDNDARYFYAYFGDRKRVADVLKSSVSEIQKYAIIRASLEPGWFCWRIKARITPHENARFP